MFIVIITKSSIWIAVLNIYINIHEETSLQCHVPLRKLVTWTWILWLQLVDIFTGTCALFLCLCSLKKKKKIWNQSVWSVFCNVPQNEKMKPEKQLHKRLALGYWEGLDWLWCTFGPCIILAWGLFGNSQAIFQQHLAAYPHSLYTCMYTHSLKCA